jgi:hypothetical protein
MKTIFSINIMVLAGMKESGKETKSLVPPESCFQLETRFSFVSYLKGTVQRKLTWVKSGVNRKLVIWAWAAWGLFYILRGLGP